MNAVVVVAVLETTWFGGNDGDDDDDVGTMVILVDVGLDDTNGGKSDAIGMKCLAITGSVRLILRRGWDNFVVVAVVLVVVVVVVVGDGGILLGMERCRFACLGSF